MADLRDIAPTTSVEAIRTLAGHRLVVRGLNGGDIAAIVARFPAIVMLFGGADASAPTRLIAQFGAAIGPVIAAGCNCLGDEKAEMNACALPLEDQMKLVTSIYRLTFPNGASPVVEMAMAMIGEPAAPVKPVRMRLKKSPSRSPPSSDADSRPTMQ